jgi:hypothetical protein
MKLISKDSRNLKLAVLAHGNLSTLLNVDVFSDLDDDHPDFSSNLGFLLKDHEKNLGYETEDNRSIKVTVTNSLPC